MASKKTKTQWLLIHGGYSYNVLGPFNSFEDAAEVREHYRIRTDKSRIVEIGDQLHRDIPVRKAA